MNQTVLKELPCCGDKAKFSFGVLITHMSPELISLFDHRQFSAWKRLGSIGEECYATPAIAETNLYSNSQVHFIPSDR